jgi:hypothetical protein
MYMSMLSKSKYVVIVPDSGSRDRVVVFAGAGCWGIWEGMLGIWNGEGMGRGLGRGGQFTSNLGSRWTGSYHAKEGFQVSKREWKRSKRELARGRKQGDCAMNNVVICIHVYNNCPNVECS